MHICQENKGQINECCFTYHADFAERAHTEVEFNVKHNFLCTVLYHH